MGAMTFTLSNPAIYQTGGKVGRWFMRNIPFVVNNGLNPWFKNREMPEPPKESFREWYLNNKKS